jgi:pimeloyl-ACP methyl ester carboxylesterase
MRVMVNGVRLFFDAHGEKLVPDGPCMRERPTVVLLHGGPGFDHSTFKPAFAPLAEIAQVITLDHRGNGRSDHGDPALWNLDQWGDDIRTFCDVLGYSFGGFVAQAYATTHPDHPLKLVLYSTSPVLLDLPVLDAFEAPGGAEVRAVAEAYFAHRTPQTTAAFRKTYFPLYNTKPGNHEQSGHAIMNNAVSIHFFEGEGKRMDFRPLLHRITCPTLEVAGAMDPPLPAGLRPDDRRRDPARSRKVHRVRRLRPRPTQRATGADDGAAARIHFGMTEAEAACRGRVIAPSLSRKDRTNLEDSNCRVP